MLVEQQQRVVADGLEVPIVGTAFLLAANMSQQTKTTNDPHAKPGRLRNSNPVGDPSKVARCGAQTRSGAACKGPAMANGRCRMHGGASTGPRTPEGLANSRRARWKHGLYSAERKRLRRQLRWVGEFARVLSRIDEMRPTQSTPWKASPRLGSGNSGTTEEWKGCWRTMQYERQDVCFPENYPRTLQPSQRLAGRGLSCDPAKNRRSHFPQWPGAGHDRGDESSLPQSVGL